MGLYATVLSAVHSAFDAIGDLVTEVTYVRKNAETYDPTTGTLTASDTTTVIPKAAIVRFKTMEYDGDIVRTDDAVLLFPGDSLAFVPAMTDTVTFIYPGEVSARTWNIKRNLPAPRGLLHKIHIRAK